MPRRWTSLGGPRCEVSETPRRIGNEYCGPAFIVSKLLVTLMRLGSVPLSEETQSLRPHSHPRCTSGARSPRVRPRTRAGTLPDTFGRVQSHCSHLPLGHSNVAYVMCHPSVWTSTVPRGLLDARPESTLPMQGPFAKVPSTMPANSRSHHSRWHLKHGVGNEHGVLQFPALNLPFGHLNTRPDCALDNSRNYYLYFLSYKQSCGEGG